jgi:CRISPR-associated protein Csm1
MSDTVYKISLAAFLHDIGKFAQRAAGNAEKNEIVPGFYMDKEFLNNNRDLYQPHFKGKYTHLHAVYTAAFIDHLEKILPSKFNKADWGLDDSFINLAAKHHTPETPLQWIVAIADRVSSGFDRESFEQTYNRAGDIAEYKKVRLATIMEQLSKEESAGQKKNMQYRYPLKAISPQSIFPALSITPTDNETAEKEYQNLLLDFADGLEKLIKTGHGENIPLWFEHFDSLFMICASHIPAATVGQDIPDVSLYDHSKITSAIAASLYYYHKETDTLNINDIKDYDTNKFLLINGEFYGIQNFIFSEGGSTGKASAKILRGRSFYVSLLTELAADMLCREIGLPPSSTILNAAGKFTILAPNTESVKDAIKKSETEINNWLIANFYGETSMGFASVEASCNDFVMGNFPALLENLSSAIDERKFKKMNIEKYGGVVSGYLDGFDNRAGICPFCGKRPAIIGVTVPVSQDESFNSCKICKDQIFIGENLVKKERIALTTTDADIKDRLEEPIFQKYQIAFTTGKLIELSKKNALLKYWDIGIPEDGNYRKEITSKFINGYVPKYTQDDESDEMIERYLYGDKSEKKKEEIFDNVKEMAPKTFYHIAKMALNRLEHDKRSSDKKFEGIEAIGVFKADVDNLGLLFATGLNQERLTLSRLATMSRQMNHFFALYLPHLLRTKKKFNDIYTVFAGGDDLFLIGPWNRTVDLARLVYEKFREYTCCNPDITLSAGLYICKPDVPVLILANESENVLDASKSGGRDRITIFGETVRWDDFSALEEIKKILEGWKVTDIVNNAMLYRFNSLLYMAERERKILESGSRQELHLNDLDCLKWPALFRYTIARNIGGKDKELIDEVMKAGQWIRDYKGGFKIPLWQVIYNHR